MDYPMRRFVTSFIVLGLLTASIFPSGVEAAKKKTVQPVKKSQIAMNLYNPNIRYGDEKQEIANPTSRCLTATAKALRAKDLKTAEADGKKASVDLEAESALTKGYKKYLLDLDYAWEALEAPYCGFGAFGSSAAVKSYTKTVTRARAAFLNVVKKNTK